MRTHRSHRPYDIDANERRHIYFLTHFGQQSDEISKTIAQLVTELATEKLNQEFKEPYNACR